MRTSDTEQFTNLLIAKAVLVAQKFTHFLSALLILRLARRFLACNSFLHLSGDCSVLRTEHGFVVGNNRLATNIGDGIGNCRNGFCMLLSVILLPTEPSVCRSQVNYLILWKSTLDRK